MPPGSGVPVPGANAGSRTSTSTREEDRARRRPRRSLRSTTSRMPEVAHVVHEERRDASLALPRELAARPASSRAARSGRTALASIGARLGRGGTSASRASARRRRPRVPVSVCVSKWTRPTGRDRAAHARARPARRSSGRRRARSGSRPRRRPARRSRSIAACVRVGSAGSDRRVAEVDDRVSSANASILASRCGPGGQLAGADRARAEARARPVGDEVVRRRRTIANVDTGELGGSCV